MKIPQALLTQILRANEIVEFISAQVPLRRVGDIYEGQCPFHLGREDDLKVDPATQTFKCMGCGVGGSVIRFAMEKDQMRFPEAVRRLARRRKIPVEIGVEFEPPPGETARPTEWVKHIEFDGPGIRCVVIRQSAPGARLADAPAGHLSIDWKKTLKDAAFTVPADGEDIRDQLVSLLREVAGLLERGREHE